MSNSTSLNTSLVEVTISRNTECVFICDLSDLTLQMIVHAWWASINVGLKSPVGWNYSRHEPWWQFNLHCGIEETGSPGIMCIVCHQVLHPPFESGTRSMGKYLLANAHITTLNKLTDSEVTEFTISTVDATALAILKRQGSLGILITSSQQKFIFDI